MILRTGSQLNGKLISIRGDNGTKRKFELNPFPMPQINHSKNLCWIVNVYTVAVCHLFIYDDLPKLRGLNNWEEFFFKKSFHLWLYWVLLRNELLYFYFQLALEELRSLPLKERSRLTTLLRLDLRWFQNKFYPELDQSCLEPTPAGKMDNWLSFRKS